VLLAHPRAVPLLATYPVPTPPSAPADYYDRWFTAGLTALVHGFTT
jgi:hypothetical protein